jgi:hypothetical protein
MTEIRFGSEADLIGTIGFVRLVPLTDIDAPIARPQNGPYRDV